MPFSPRFTPERGARQREKRAELEGALAITQGKSRWKLFTLYAPPEEEVGTLHRDKAEAEAAEAAKS